MYFALGFRKATSAILAHPALILTPAFTFWTFGNDFRLCGNCKKGLPRLGVSFRLTWINAIMSITECMILIIHFFPSVLPRLELELFLSILLSLFGLSLISLLLIQFLDKCSSCCSGYFQRNCLPMYEKVVYDVDVRKQEDK